MKRIEIYDDNGILKLRVYGYEFGEKNVTSRTALRYLEELSSMKAQSYSESKVTAHETDVLFNYKNVNVTLRNIEKIVENNHARQLMFFEKEVSRLDDLEKTRRLREKRKEERKVTRENKHSNKKISFIRPIALTTALGITFTMAFSLLKSKNVSTNKDIPTSITDTIKDELGSTSDDITNIATDVPHLIDGPIFLVDEGEIEQPEDTDILVDVSQVGNRTETNKAQYTRDTYGNIIEKYSNMYGLDPELMIAIATQERGTHSSKKDQDGATGLMQIQNSVWVGEKITAYNHETGKNDSFIVTEKMLGDLETNIQIGCMYFQDCLKKFNFNPLLAVQCYNYGYGNLNKVLNAYSNDSGKSKQEIIEDSYDTGWMDYRNVVKNRGDKKYVEHVFSYLNGNEISLGNRETRLNFSFDFGYDNNDNIKTN